MNLPPSLNNSMDGILNNIGIWEEYGVFVASIFSGKGLNDLIDLFEKENPDYKLYAVGHMPSSRISPWSHGSIFLGHNKNSSIVSVLDENDNPYINKEKSSLNLQLNPNDSLYIPPFHSIRVDAGIFYGLRLGYKGEDKHAENYTHHLPHEILATDPVLPYFGCGDKKNHYSKYSVHQGGRGRIPQGDPRLRPLPAGKLEPNFSDVYGAHFVTIAKSPVHSHEIGEIYFGGDGVLFVYDNQLEKVIALELNPNTVLYLSKEPRGRPPIHGAVARDLDNPKGVWVAVPGEWQAETKYDTQQDIISTKQHDGRMTPHLGKVIEDRLPRPMNKAGQEFAAEVFQYSK